MAKASARKPNGKPRETARTVSVRLVEKADTMSPIAPAPGTFGEYLRAARSARGITVRDISVRTRIALRSLEALEQNEIGKLPGGIFSRAFVRAYAQEVGLDPDETVRLFVQQFPIDHVTAGSTDANEGEIGRDQEAQRRSRRFIYVLTAAIGIPLVGLTAYLSWSSGRTASASDVTPPTGTPSAVTPTPVSTSAAPPATNVASTTTPAAAPAARSTAPASITTNAGKAASLPASDALRIAIAADGPCWIRIKGDGAMRYQGLLNAGDKQTGEARDSLEVIVGDAAKFRYSINGRPGRSLWKSGEVVVARITRDNWQTWLQQ
jgi:cytoskeleton protein RodZ